VKEKLEIIYRFFVLHQLQSDVAKMFHVTSPCIYIICKKIERNCECLDELLCLREAKTGHLKLFSDTVLEMNELNVFIDSAWAVKKAIADGLGEDASEHVIRRVMCKDLNIHYRKTIPVSVHGKYEKNLVLRQQFALQLIRLLSAGKTLLNIDETWLGMTDFRRRKWRAPGTTNSVAQLEMRPRVSMIMGIDTKGDVYLSLLQANSNGQVMEIFFRALVKKLDKERAHWRDDTVLILDGAPYHNSKATMKLLEVLKIPVLFTGPHSYAGVPCELWFSAFKSKDVNPRKVPTAKR